MVLVLTLLALVWLILFAVLAWQDFKYNEIDLLITVLWFILSVPLGYALYKILPGPIFGSNVYILDDFASVLFTRLVSVTFFLVITLGIIKMYHTYNHSKLPSHLGAGDIIVIYGLGLILDLNSFYSFIWYSSLLGIIWHFSLKKEHIPFVTILFVGTLIRVSLLLIH